MTQDEILEYNKMCAEFLGLKKRVDNEKEKEWYLSCYPTLSEHREAYNLPLNFPIKYEHPEVVFALYHNTKNVPVQNQRVCVAKLKFHSDWNWIMEVVEAIENLPIKYTIVIKDISCDIHNIFKMDKEFSTFARNNGLLNKRMAVVKAINTFLIWHNENK